MSAKYKSPSFLLPNELNTSANTANDTGINSLYSMDFDGSSYISLGDDVPPFNQTTSKFSISFWLYNTAYPLDGNHCIFENRINQLGGSSYNSGISFESRTSGRLFWLLMYPSSSYNYVTFPQTELNEDEWNHIAIVFDGTESNYQDRIEIYVNNSPVTLNYPQSSVPTQIAGASAGDEFRIAKGLQYNFVGQMDEFCVFSKSLTSTDVSSLWNSGTPAGAATVLNLGASAYYPLGEQAQNSGYPSASGNEWQFPNGVLQDYVMDFDGTDYIDAGVILSLNNASEFTISTWVKLNDLTNNYRIFGNREFSSPYKGLGVETGSGSNAGKLFFYSMSNNGSYPSVGITMSNEGITANNWFLLTCKYKNSTQEIFINGSSTTVTSGSKTSNVASTTDTTTANFLIGADSIGSSGKLNGELSNFQIFNTGVNVTGSNSIETLYNNGSPLTSMSGFTSLTNWWKLNADSVYTPSAPNYTTALDFVSSESDYIDCGDSDSFSFGDTATDSPFSISAWVNMADATNFITIAKDANSGREYVIRTLSDDKLYFYLLDNINGGYVGRISSGTVTSNQSTWIHTSYTYNGDSSSSGIKIYLNGSQVDNDNYEGGLYTAMSNTSTNLNIGRQERGLNYANGSISNVAIFNTALTQAQVSTLFNFGTPETNISFDPVAWWKLNDQTAITDYSGNGNTGTNNGATNAPGGVAYVPSWKITSALPITTTPNYTTAVDFTGSGNYINTSFNPATTIGNNNSWTMSVWLNSSDFQTIVKFFGAYTGTRFWLGARYGNVQYGFGPSNVNMSNADLPENEWCHVALVYEHAQSEVRCYVNSLLKETDSWTQSASPASFFRIGDVAGDSRNYNGKMSNLAIYNTALSAPNISTLYNDGTPQNTIFGSPVAWWKLDNTTTITDSSNNGYTGTIVGSLSESTTDVLAPQPVNGVSTTLPSTALQQSDLQFDSPYSNYSLKFSTTQRVDTNFTLPASYTSYSYSIWYKQISTISGDNYVVGNLNNSVSGTANSRAAFRFNNGTNRIRIIGGDDTTQYYLQYSATPSSILDGNWHHIAVTVINGEILLYIDSVKQTPASVVGTPVTGIEANGNYVLGHSGNNTYPGNLTNSLLDEFAIFDKKLTEAEILSIYNNGKPGDISPIAPTNWWRLGENAYFVNNNITLPNSVSGAPNGVSSGTATSMLTADAPGTYANGIGDGLAITDRVGDAPLSVANSQSYNMIPDDKVPYVPGYVGDQVANNYSMNFDSASSDYLRVPNTTDFDFGTGDFTWSLWVNYETHVNYAGLLFTGISNSEYRLKFQFSGQILYMQNADGDSQVADLGTNITGTGWHHLCLVRSSGTITTYLDGSAVDTDSRAGNVNSNGNDLLIGKNASSYFDGKMDEIAIWNTALTADQIKFDLYKPTALVGGVEKTADIENNTNLPTPVAWYRMGD